MSREALMGSARCMQRFYAAAYLLSINPVDNRNTVRARPVAWAESQKT
jgi:hypothetical protein